MVERTRFKTEIKKLGFEPEDFIFGSYEDLLRNRIILKTAIGIAYPEQCLGKPTHLWTAYLAAEEKYVRQSRAAGINLNRGL